MVTAHCRGYRSESVEFDAQARARETLIELRPLAEWLRGRVRTEQGAPVEGVRVCAWTFGQFATLRRLGDALRQRELPEDLTAVDGTFALELGADAKSWSCAAAGAGYITPTTTGIAVGEQGWLELTARPIHATRVRWLDGDGGPLRASSALREGSTADGRLESKGTPLRTEWSALALLGINEADLRLVGRESTLFVFSPSDSATADTMTVALTKSAPGYEPAEATIDLPRLEREIPELDFRLQRRADSFSRVFVQFGAELRAESSDDDAVHAAPPIASLVGTRQSSVVTVHFKSASQDTSYAFAIWTFTPQLQELGGVPCGDYVTWWSTDCGALPPKPTPLRIEGQRTVLTLPAKPLGELHASVSDRHGQPFEGLLVLQLECLAFSRTDPDTCFISFVESPYTIEGLTPGPYRIRVKHPPELSGLLAREFTLGAGESLSLSLGR